MPPTALNESTEKSWLDRSLSIFADVRSGEGATALLMLGNIFLLLVCYSVIKTVREPLILLGGGAEVRSYAAAGQALLLMGFVPLYSWFATRVNRAKLLVGVTLFFIACVELFAMAVAARVPYVGVAFFIWVGIFNVSLVAQFWSFANDIYSKDAGDRLFPIIVIGMTAGAPLGSFIAGRLFRSGMTPNAILHISAALLAASVAIYLWIHSRHEERSAVPQPAMSAAGGFQLVLRSRYLRLIAALVVLLNIVNTTGEYVVARLLTIHVNELAAADAALNKQSYIGSFTGDYQFWVNVIAFLLQAFVSSRLIKHRGLQGALIVLPLVALGGYAVIAAGVGFSVVRWIKTAENATDYSIMNTARQLLWLPTSREEKYKAKQAIDAFFVRGGDVLSAVVVYVGSSMLHLSIEQFAMANIALTLVWIGVAFMILEPRTLLPRMSFRPVATATLVVAIVASAATPARAQATREDERAALQAAKAAQLHPYEPTVLERRIERIGKLLEAKKGPVYPFVGGVFSGGGLALGPGYIKRFGDTGLLDAHVAWSVKNYKSAAATLALPRFANNRVAMEVRGNWLDAPSVAFYGTGNESLKGDRTGLFYRTASIGVATRVQAARYFAVGGGVDAIQMKSGSTTADSPLVAVSPSYRRSHVFAEVDWRTSPGYTTRGGLYRVEFSDYRQTNTGAHSFGRLDAEVQQFVPILRENSVIALRALASSTHTAAGETVPYVLLPDLGGSHTLRGYSAWRFRDRNRVLLTGEYRWKAGHFVDMALFIDAGHVAPRFKSLDLSEFRKTYGLGMSFHTPVSTVTRVELARTREGNSLVVSFSPSF
jgi:AAA family ATP:ADP antiporter